MNKKTACIVLDVKLIKALDYYSKATKLNKSDIVSIALVDYLKDKTEFKNEKARKLLEQDNLFNNFDFD